MQIYSATFNYDNISKISSKAKQVSFKGVNKQDNESQITYYNVDMRSFLNNPVVSLYLQLIQDGFTTEEIKKAEIFQTLHIKPEVDVQNLARHIDEFVKLPSETKNRMFNYASKSADDLKAVIRVYQQLKKKFITDDVIEEQNQTSKIINTLNAHFGKKTSPKSYTKRMMLEVLHYTNKYNESIAKALLNDRNFNNNVIVNALMGVETEKKAHIAADVLAYAQDLGYDKEFSFPLAIIISEANEQNVQVVKRLLDDEQEFLSNNSDFTAIYLMNFLRLKNPLVYKYMSDPEMSLQTIYDVLQAKEDYDNFD